ncbi:ribonuclease HIII, partial [Striga asiatica]
EEDDTYRDACSPAAGTAVAMSGCGPLYLYGETDGCGVGGASCGGGYVVYDGGAQYLWRTLAAAEEDDKGGGGGSSGGRKDVRGDIRMEGDSRQWAAVYESRVLRSSLRFLCSLCNQATSMEEDIAVKLESFQLSDRENNDVPILSEDIQHSAVECGKSLYGEIIGQKKAHLASIRRAINQMWQIRSSVIVRELSPNFF